MKLKLLIAVSTVAVIASGGLAIAATNDTASCTASPTITRQTDGAHVSIDCVIPNPPAVTVTVTASPSPTVTPTPTPTVTPTATPTAQTGYPDASNTGPTGTLTAYTGPMVVKTANTVINSKVITGDLIIQAANVQVTNSQIDGTIGTDENSTGYSFTITDSIVNAGSRVATGIGAVNFKVLRTEVQGGNRSINCWKSCDVRDSYVHGQFKDTTGSAHESGIRMGATNAIVHNTILCDAPDVAPDAGCSADLTGYGDFAAVTDVLVQNNLLKATTGGACAYGGSSSGKPYSSQARDIRFINNVFERGNGGKCGYYFAVTDFDPARPGNVWSGNTWDNGLTLSP